MLKIKTSNVYLIPLFYYSLVIIGALIHYFTYGYIGSLVVLAIFIIIATLASSVISVSMNNGSLIIEKRLLFNLLSVSKKQIDLSEITAIKYTIYRVGYIFMWHPSYKLQVFFSRNYYECISFFNKKDLDKLVDSQNET